MSREVAAVRGRAGSEEEEVCFRVVGVEKKKKSGGVSGRVGGKGKRKGKKRKSRPKKALEGLESFGRRIEKKHMLFWFFEYPRV
jgi:hypothetical protein